MIDRQSRVSLAATPTSGRISLVGDDDDNAACLLEISYIIVELNGVLLIREIDEDAARLQRLLLMMTVTKMMVQSICVKHD